VSGISVLTQNIDNGRSGWNKQETTLTPGNVGQLKKLGSIKTAAPCTTQVLYYDGLNLNGHKNVLFCWTNADQDNTNTTVYAIDADSFAIIWEIYVGQGAIWATHAAAIDPATNYMYFVYKNDNDNGYNYLMGIDIMKGAELPGSHLLINDSVKGNGAMNVGGMVPFQNTDSGNGKRLHNDCRTSMLIVNSVLFFGFAHNSDSYPYHGWAFSYQYDAAGKKFNKLASYCVTANDDEGGVWQGGQGFASDGTSVYFTTGNGPFKESDGSMSMAVLKMSFDLKIQDYFVPAKWQSFSNADLDLGGCGPIIIPNTKYLFVGVTKYASVHLIDTTNMGKFDGSKDSCKQTIVTGSGYTRPGGNPVAWDTGNGAKIYVWAPGEPIYQFNYNSATEKIDEPFVTWKGNLGGGGLQITSNGGNNAILWAFGLGDTYAFDATKDISAGPIWTASLRGPASWGWPTISNGKVYLPSYDSTMSIYGLN
jgi:hypothetical protein